MKHIQYFTQGTCSRVIDIDVDENNIVRKVGFIGGCHGNLQGIARLVEGLPADQVIEKLKGIRCGAKATSCPDQLANALEQEVGS